MDTKLIEKLPKVKVYHLHIKLFGKDDVYASSLSCQKLTAVLNYVQQNEESNFETFRIFETFVANTYDSDDNGVYDTLSSFRNFI